MFRWAPFPFIRFSIFLSVGIILYDHFPSLWINHLWVGLSLLGQYVLLVWLGHRYTFYQYSVINGLSGLLVVAYLGGIVTKVHDHSQTADHYSNYADITGFSGTIVSGMLEKEKYYRYELAIAKVRTEDSLVSASGKVHCYLKKPIREIPEYGDRIFVYADLLPIPPPMNPNEFDYARYMARNQIYSQAFVPADQMKVVQQLDRFSMVAFSLDIRERVREALQQYFSDPEQRQIAMALIVGVKDYLDQDMKKAYSTAGATHVLAVSGLHVGIIYLFLNYLFGKLKSNRIGGYGFMLIALAIIWLYAMVTGLSASVFRAACMFSILSIAEATSNRRNIYNSLGVAAFVLLLCNPQYLFQVGFQLSFLAVFGIVYLFPRIYNRLVMPNKLLNWVWSVTCVSVAAQVSTAPLSLYYFHQFPTYFLISNLVVIPAAFLILFTGLPMLGIGAVFPVLGSGIAWALGKIIGLLNTLVQSIEALPASKLDWLYLTPPETLLIYGVLLGWLWSLQYRTFSNFSWAVICLCLFFSSKLYGKLRSYHKEEVIVYELKDQVAMDFISEGTATLVIRDSIADLSLLKFQLDPNRLHEGFRPIEDSIVYFQDVFQGRQMKATIWRGLRMLSVSESLTKYEFQQPVETDVLMISENALKEAELDQFRYQHLVFDSTCDYWYLRRMRSFCEAHDIAAHFIPMDGFWTLSLIET